MQRRIKLINYCLTYKFYKEYNFMKKFWIKFIRYLYQNNLYFILFIYIFVSDRADQYAIDSPCDCGQIWIDLWK